MQFCHKSHRYQSIACLAANGLVADCVSLVIIWGITRLAGFWPLATEFERKDVSRNDLLSLAWLALAARATEGEEYPVLDKDDLGLRDASYR